MKSEFLRFVIKKFLIMVLTVFLISLAVFYIITLPPGDFLTNYVGQLQAAGESVSQETIDKLKAVYGLDQPFIVQYWKWVTNIVFHGDFGYSFLWKMPVTSVIQAYIVPTIVLSLVTMLFTYLISIPIGIYSAVHQYSLGDYLFTSIGFIGMAVPNFLLVIILMFIAFKLTGDTMLGFFSAKYQTAPWSLEKFIDLLKHCIIPILVIGLMNTCGLMRTMRSQMLDELSKNHQQISELCQKVTLIEHAVDDIYGDYISYLFENEKDEIELLKYKEIAQVVEDTTDRAKEVTGTVKSLLIKES